MDENHQRDGYRSLLQPTPEVYELFDDVLCLRDGTPVYHGDVDKVVDHFGGLGFDSENAKKGDVGLVVERFGGSVGAFQNGRVEPVCLW